MSEHGRKEYVFFVDEQQFKSEHASLSGAAIKQIAGVQATYQLFEEEKGDAPDRQITDTAAVDLTQGSKHFYAVPPATFGSDDTTGKTT